jgi:DMSO/TMAO reductase YedYZ molybdopterin-dependent catalytic subunit
MKKVLIASFVLICILAGSSALFGEMPYKPYMTQGMRIAAASSTDEPDNTGTAEENADEVYEATKDLHTTGIPQDVNIETWRLQVEGDKIETALSLSYEDLKKMSMVKKEVTLICPGVFTDNAEWEGISLSDILDQARIQDGYKRVTIHGLDGYRSHFTPEEIERNLIFLALKVNGVTIPKEHGYPARIVAEEISGGKWVKWVDKIEVK